MNLIWGATLYSKGAMGEIELSTIAFAFIAIVAVGLFLVFFMRSYPDIATSAYCRLNQAANAIIFIGQKPPVPPECGLSIGTIRKDIRSTQSGIARDISEFAVDCWKKGQQGTGGETFNCYEMNIEISDASSVGEDLVTAKLSEAQQCNYLPNNLLDKTNTNYPCGDENKIIWEEDISNDFYIIKYDAFRKAVVVK